MNSSENLTCKWNTSCYFIDSNGQCLTNNMVLDLILKYVKPTTYEWMIIILYIIVFIVGTVGNVLICIVIQRNRSMRTVTNMFIMNLAIADVLILVFCLPPTVIQDVTKTWFFGLFFCKFTVSISVSVLTLLAISVERYYAIVYPLKFTGTKQRARIVLFGVWILSILLAMPDVVMMTLSQQFDQSIKTNYLTYCQWHADPLFDLLYQLHITLCLFVIPLCFMIPTYTGIVKVLWGSIPTEKMLSGKQRTISYSQHTLSDVTVLSDDVSVHTPLNGIQKSANLIVQENRQKAAKMLIAVVVIFAICYLPVHLFNLFRHVGVYMEHNNAKKEKVIVDQADICFEPKLVSLNRTGTIKIITISALISHWLPYFNSSINPVIYNIMSDKFRRKFNELSQCCGQYETETTLLKPKMFKVLNTNSPAIKHDIKVTAYGIPHINRLPTNSNNANNSMHDMTATKLLTTRDHKRTGQFRLTNV
ncbi:unnamed protein product [Didymodactylos carnosus]|uniref:G-protein coupled receptors family 1 profile domain-containing protein n=1 Tax=Didymodactylos carnosus TaxID=1234261 RepID=A0A813WVS8_9BILA|nr:unnamed protein product [Didymodactylos carnosus]CAF3645603.1 unnamed protein product [Didymodactylos carnosus]